MLEGLFGYVEGQLPLDTVTDRLKDQAAQAKITLAVQPQ